MNNELIGKLQYIGPNYKYGLTDGKIYDCFGLSSGDVQIFDDEKELYYYSATKPYNDVKNGAGKWILINDYTNGELSDFISGKKSRTSIEIEYEKDNVISSVEVQFPKNKKDFVKYVTKKYVYIKKTPEVIKYQEKILRQFAESLIPIIEKDLIKNETILPNNKELKEK